MDTDDLNTHGANQQTLVSTGVADEWLHLLSEQRDLYVRLGALTDSQRALITGDEPQRLLAVLGERQKLIDQLSCLAERMRPYRQRWPQMRSELTPSEADQVDQLLGEVDALLAGILEKDKADTQLLAARKSSVGQAMATLKTGKQAKAAYAAAAYQHQGSVDWTDQ